MDIVAGHPVVGSHMIQLHLLFDVTYRRTIDSNS